MELWVNELWLLGTAVVFTYVGFQFGRIRSTVIIEAMVDGLIRDGFLKTEGSGDNMQIIKWQDWCKNDQDPG